MTDSYWAMYRYTDPIAKALTEHFGADFSIYNTGGGCICLHAEFEAGLYVLVGSAADGPLLTFDETKGEEYGGGFGAGIYSTETGQSLSDFTDYTATTPKQVIACVRRALDNVFRYHDGTYVSAQIGLDGIESETKYKS